MLPRRAESTQRFIKSSVLSVLSVVTPHHGRMLPRRAESTQRFIKSSVLSVLSVVTPHHGRMLPRRAESTQKFMKSSVLSVVSVVTPHHSRILPRRAESTQRFIKSSVLSVLSVVPPPSQQDATTESREYTEVYKILRALCALCGKIFIPAFPFRGSAYHTIIKVDQTFIRIATHLSSRLRLQPGPNFGNSGWACATRERKCQSGCRQA